MQTDDQNLLGGLDDLGLGGFESMDLFADNKEKQAAEEKAKKEAVKKNEPKEEELVFEKTYECPACGEKFKSLTVRSGKLKAVSQDRDLRWRYKQLEPLKYDVVMCPECGCAALSSEFGKITGKQAKMIKENISANFKPQREKKAVYSYDDALARYKVALANSMVRGVKASEKAFICLKTGWLLRGKAEQLNPGNLGYEQVKAKTLAEEKAFMKNALEGFINARQSESFPMCGMDELTVDYLIAALSVEFGEKDRAMKLLSDILVSRTASERLKNKARDLKDTMR
ncbi:MAG: DUF2225 domain-containing protein [Lachnospiraceae bacterium]|nr:DUF2225 domain-containing protein [Lachnospiraceae bacterium]